MVGENSKITESVDKEPVRLNKYLSDAGFCSRREADRLIEAGRVSVDGAPAELGSKVLPAQTVCVDGVPVKAAVEKVLIAYNKPVGVECTTDADNPDNIIDRIGYPERIYPIGRLDKNSSGLILLTNEGEIVNRILKSSNEHEKEYIVTIDKPVTGEFLRLMGAGVKIRVEDRHPEGEKRTYHMVTTRKCAVTQSGEYEFHIILTQGYNRQIRRMCKALGAEVVTLKRIRVVNICLGDLLEGAYREVTVEEYDRLLEEIGEK